MSLAFKQTEDEVMCYCYSSGMNEPEYQPNSSEVIKNLLIDDWTWHRDPYVCDFTSDAQIQGQTVTFHPFFSFGTAAVRGEKPLTARTQAYWEIMVPYCYGTSMMFGIGTAETQMRLPVYFDDILGGTNNTSMGLSHKGFIHRDQCKAKFISPLPEREAGVFGIYFNGPEKTLSYFFKGEPLGAAFININTNETYYPMISSTAQRSQFTLFNTYSNISSVIPPSLFDICVLKALDSVVDPQHLAMVLPSSIMKKVVEKSLLQVKNNQNISKFESYIEAIEPKCTRCNNFIIEDITFQPGLCNICVSATLSTKLRG